MKTKCLVTGGEGFIASYICKALVANGYEVRSIDYRTQPNGHIDGVQYHFGDIRDVDLLNRVMKGVDVVFHIAGLPRATDSLSDPEGTLSVNVLGTRAVLEVAHTAGVRRVVFASSSAIYGDQDHLPLVETMFPLPLSPYGFQKYLGEKLMQKYAEEGALETVSLRFFNAYGYWTDLTSTGSLAITRFLTARASGTPITIYGDGVQTRDFVHVDDIARACIKASENASVGKAEVINIASGKAVNMNTIAELIGGPVTHIQGPAGEIRDSLASIERAKELLDWSPQISLKDGMTALKQAWGIV